MKAYEDFKKDQQYLLDTASILKMKNPYELQERLQKLLEENANLKKLIAEAERKEMNANAQNLISQAEDINGVSVLFVDLKDYANGDLKPYAETLRNQLKEGVVFVRNVTEGKVTFVCAVTKDTIAKGVKAGELVKLAATITGGNGGGRPDMAQAGGKGTDGKEEEFNAIRTKLQSL